MSDKPQPHHSNRHPTRPIPRGELTEPGEPYVVFDGGDWSQPGLIHVSGPGIHEQQPFYAASIKSLINRVYQEGYQHGRAAGDRSSVESHSALSDLLLKHKKSRARAEQIMRLASKELERALVGQDRPIALEAFAELTRALAVE